MNSAAPLITGVILAGGQGSRLGHQDKPLLDVGGKRIIEHIISKAQPQVTRLVLNVNRNPHKFASLGLPMIQDRPGATGPLVGILSAMEWCQQNNQHSGFVACFPGDVPWFPVDIVTRLLSAVTTEGSDTGWVCSNGQWQPLFSLWSLQIHEHLTQAVQNNVYSPMQVLRSTKHVVLDITGGPMEHFLNINSPEDLEKARSLASFV